MSEAHPHPKPSSSPPPTTKPKKTYATTRSPPPHPSTQDLIDHNWITLAHQIGLAQNPLYPFGAAIVDSRNNSLLCASANQMQNVNAPWSSFAAHGMFIIALYSCKKKAQFTAFYFIY
jgi:hypothetical protein